MVRERLQKVLSAAGLGSRRACEQMILDRRVAVNGELVDEIPAFADPQTDRITIDGRKQPKLTQPRIYLLLNKPAGVVSSAKDPAGRKTVLDLIRGRGPRLYPVGRLDKDSQGLILLTNDGELTKRLTHPRYEVERAYEVEIGGAVDGAVVEKLMRGVWLAEGKARAKHVRILQRGQDRSVMEITLTENKNRQVRRMLAKLAMPVRRLTCVRFGPIALTGVKTGHYRPLTKRELTELKILVNSG
jgi:pseudouridine synthase